MCYSTTFFSESWCEQACVFEELENLQDIDPEIYRPELECELASTSSLKLRTRASLSITSLARQHVRARVQSSPVRRTLLPRAQVVLAGDVSCRLLWTDQNGDAAAKLPDGSELTQTFLKSSTVPRVAVGH